MCSLLDSANGKYYDNTVSIYQWVNVDQKLKTHSGEKKSNISLSKTCTLYYFFFQYWVSRSEEEMQTNTTVQTT